MRCYLNRLSRGNAMIINRSAILSKKNIDEDLKKINFVRCGLMKKIHFVIFISNAFCTICNPTLKYCSGNKRDLKNASTEI